MELIRQSAKFSQASTSNDHQTLPRLFGSPIALRLPPSALPCPCLV